MRRADSAPFCLCNRILHACVLKGRGLKPRSMKKNKAGPSGPEVHLSG